ncbi:hypothetical protein PENSPDRAFT_682237 [Peniophora sp. CONT]|nr:hypothetical protein PENSPDRAFT_682237 [Peniophora sp. CONT]
MQRQPSSPYSPPMLQDVWLLRNQLARVLATATATIWPYETQSAAPKARSDHTSRDYISGWKGIFSTEKCDPSPIQALIIGIDNYKSKEVKDLDGAVADADDMYNFLRADLQVPDKQIVNLRNERATRSAILTELRALQKRDARAGDPFLVYFAGHGALAKGPDASTVKRHVSMLVPYDGDIGTVQQKHCTHNIPDWTIGGLLDELAGYKDSPGKGNNITVILDCCHSGSGTRNSLRPRRIVMKDDYQIPCDLDQEITDGTAKKATSFFGSNMKSHVLLSACREGQLAYERDGRGQFTQALLRTLRSTSAHKITYRELLKRVVVKEQTPQCEGYHSDRLIFDARSPSRGCLPYTVSQDGGKYIVDAGLAHGVNEGSQFDVYSSLDFMYTNIPLATMVATCATPFHAELRTLGAHLSTLDLKATCIAVQTSTGTDISLRLHVLPTEDLLTVMEAIEMELQRPRQQCTPRITLSHWDHANLSVRARGGRIEYLICDPLVSAYGLHSLFQTTGADTQCIQPVLRAAGDFFWHLHRSPLPEKRLLDRWTSVEVYKLRKSANGGSDIHTLPLHTRYGENLCRSGRLDVTVGDDGMVYGIVLHNSSKVPLYVWAFYFDCSDLSIAEFYRPTAMGLGAEPSIPANGELSIGFGSCGGQPFECILRPNQTMDVGFLKFFVLTEPADLSGIAQMSPFEPRRPRDIHQDGWKISTWDTITVPVVQRKHGTVVI